MSDRGFEAKRCRVAHAARAVAATPAVPRCTPESSPRQSEHCILRNAFTLCLAELRFGYFDEMWEPWDGGFLQLCGEGRPVQWLLVPRAVHAGAPDVACPLGLIGVRRGRDDEMEP